MKTVDPSKLTADTPRTTEVPPTSRPAPSRTGLLGTILTELEFGEDEQAALRDLSAWIAEDFDEIVESIATSARLAALHSERVLGSNPLDRRTSVRPSIRNLRKHGTRQWLKATLGGVFDSGFSRQVRHTWMPILLSEPYQNRATPALVGAFLSHVEGYITSRLTDQVADNLVPYYRMLHAFRTALNVQRRMFGIDEIV